MNIIAAAKYIISECRCPTCGKPSAGIVDDLGWAALDCYRCTMRARRRAARRKALTRATVEHMAHRRFFPLNQLPGR